jgi:hypothetical protein
VNNINYLQTNYKQKEMMPLFQQDGGGFTKTIISTQNYHNYNINNMTFNQEFEGLTNGLVSSAINTSLLSDGPPPG